MMCLEGVRRRFLGTWRFGILATSSYRGFDEELGLWIHSRSMSFLIE